MCVCVCYANKREKKSNKSNTRAIDLTLNIGRESRLTGYAGIVFVSPSACLYVTHIHRTNVRTTTPTTTTILIQTNIRKEKLCETHFRIPSKRSNELVGERKNPIAKRRIPATKKTERRVQRTCERLLLGYFFSFASTWSYLCTHAHIFRPTHVRLIFTLSIEMKTILSHDLLRRSVHMPTKNMKILKRDEDDFIP